MPRPAIESIGQIYFKRFKTYPSQLSDPLSSNTKIIWVIPCYNEPNIIATLDSLAGNEPPQFPIEVLVVINRGVEDRETVIQQNQQTQKQIERWIEHKQPDFIVCRVIYVDDLPPKHSGVGLARKIGMDEALRRFIAIGYDGLIMNLDADCTVSKNYLRTIENQFLKLNPTVVTVYFEHNIAQIEREELREGIVYYELFLRYYINGLRYAGFPHAFHTVGSCMGCRASTYALSGGMNRRKAGEDFYFLHKVGALGNVLEITDTTVFPSTRVSERVPFGTGKAQMDWLNHSSPHRSLYHPQTFADLKAFFDYVPDWYRNYRAWPASQTKTLPESVQRFVQDAGFEQVWNDLHASTRSWAVFQQRFFAWWDGFRVLRYVHATRDFFYPPVSSEEAGFRLLKKLCILKASQLLTAEALLKQYQTLDRQKR
ncbi:MAG: glycosyltransferase family A protein [Bacteroidota bacterium]